MTSAIQQRTREAYQSIFEAARALEYPDVTAFELRCGYALDRPRLEAAARVLACPLKLHPPHWQHGRVIYAAARKYFDTAQAVGSMLDIGTAKGFSALCLTWALIDSDSAAEGIHSIDVIAPLSTVSRNTVADLDGAQTLAQILKPWPEAGRIQFAQSTGVEYLKRWSGVRWMVAFVDGKHDAHVVRQEGKLLARGQARGDLAIFDDCQISGVNQAVVTLEEFWQFERVQAGPREYAIGWRR